MTMTVKQPSGGQAQQDAASVGKVKSMAAIRRRQQQKVLLQKTLAYIFLIIGAITMIAPFLWMITTSLKEPGAVFSFQKE